MFSCVPPASICWALGRFFMFISSLSEHPVNPGERAHPFQNTKWVQAGSGDFSALLLNGNWFPISFLLARCCHLHSHWVPPSHANNPMAINRAVHGRQRKERDTLTPPPFMPRCLTSGLGSRDRPMLPRSGCQAPGSSLHGASVSSSLRAQNSVLLWEAASFGPVYTSNTQ